MKKYLIILTTLALTALGCTQYIEETPTQRVYVDSPAINLVEVKDSSLTVSVIPAAGTGYYSIVATEGLAVSMDSMKVFKLNVSSAFYTKTVSAASEASKTVNLTGLKPFTNYTVYAVSSSTQGSVGKVTSYTLMTSDKVAPYLTDISVSKDTVVVLTFSEKVNLAQDAAFTAKYYALNKGIYDDEPQGTLTNDAIRCVVSGNQAALFLSGIPAGAYFNLAYTEGAFVDAALNKCAALEHSPFTKGTSGPENASKASGRRSTEEFELSIYGGKPVTVVTAMNSPIWISVPEGVSVAKNHSLEVTGSIIYETESDGYTKIEKFETSGKKYDFGWNSSYQCALAYPNAHSYYTGRQDPERGSYVTMNIPAYLEDIWGNWNDEFTIGPFLYSYGYSLSDMVGTYAHSGESGYGESYNEDSWTMTIAESDDSSKGNVMITDYYGFKLDTPIYAQFDVDLGTLTYPNKYQPLGCVVSEGYAYFFYTFGYYCCAKGTGQDMVLYMTKAGNLTSGDDYPGYYYEVYNMPASGNIEDITDDDYVSYNYNIFMPEFSRIQNTTSGMRSWTPGLTWLTGRKDFSLKKLAK